MNTRISISPEQFANGPLLSLVPSPKDQLGASLNTLRTLEVALFSRLEQLDKLNQNQIETSEDHQMRLQIDRERQMLKQALDWCALSSEE